VTIAIPVRETVAAFGAGGRFLHNSLGRFPPERIRDWLAEAGVATHVEMPERKVFPDPGKARDIVEALAGRARAAGAMIRCGSPVMGLVRESDGRFRVATPQGELLAGRLILTTGGTSYHKTGTTGDAYAWLESLGHRIVPIRPALMPWTVEMDWVRELAGFTLEDAAVRLAVTGATERGGFLFTHQGVSGPGPMNLTRHIPRESAPPYRLLLDPFPDEGTDALLVRLRTLATGPAAKDPQALLQRILPGRLSLALFPKGEPAHWTKGKMLDVARQLKAILLDRATPQGFDKAEVTQGGVALDEVDPRTMASRNVPGLFIAGELLDLDGPIGGYNLAAAWATGFAAGVSAARSVSGPGPA
jgi:predicted Rossmann fold flavoprotein